MTLTYSTNNLNSDSMSDRCLYIETKSKVKRYVLGKNTKPLVLVQNRIYRCDEEFMIPSKTGGDEFVPYNIDSTQPRGAGVQVDTNKTMAYIRIARASKNNHSVSILGSLNQIPPKILLYILIGGIVIYSLLMGGIK